MARSQRPVLATLAAVTLLAGCGGNGEGDGDTGPEVGGDPTALALTLTDTECSYAGPESVPAGALSIDVKNETGEPGRFELLRLSADAAPEELVAYVEGERLVLSDGGAPTWPPTFASIVAREPVRAGWSSQLGADTAAGTYGLVCFSGAPPRALYLAATFGVAG